MALMQSLTRTHRFLPSWKSLVWVPGSILLLIWLFETPPGLLGKADAIAYAICHRIDARSFHLAERQMPLCARCTGMYLGALAGIIYQLGKDRRGSFPSWKIAIPFIVAFIAFGIDGINSYLHLVPGAPTVYTSQNWLRLVTGSGLGLGIAVILVPAFNQTAWIDFLPGSLISNYKQVAILVCLAAGLDLLILSGNPLLLYPLALISSGTVMLILTMIYSMVLMMLFRRENRYTHWKELIPFLVGGVTLALLQIALLDYGRFWLTGTWQGFNLPG